VLGNLPARKPAGPPQEFPAPPGGRAERREVVEGGTELAQPSQKAFETRLHSALSALDPAKPVFAEAESRRIGSVQVPDALIAAIRAAPCLRIEATTPARVEFLLRDYAYFLENPRWLAEKLGHMRGLQSNETLARWLELVEAADFRSLVTELLEKHYDPLYQRSQTKNYRDYGSADCFSTDNLSPAGITMLAQRILAACANS
jgi:tRNA 2-selenouridine synthase